MPINTVVRLNNQGLCGSGVLYDKNKIITAAHVAKIICPAKKCDGTMILQADKVGDVPTKNISYQSLTLETQIDSIDIAVLRINTNDSIASLNSFEPLTPNNVQNIYSLNFSGCGTLQVSKGNIVKFNTLKIWSDAKGKAGSSGSPIFDEMNNLIGIVTESASFTDSIYNLAFGDSLVLKGTPFLTINDLMNLDTSASVLKQIEILNEYYMQGVIKTNDQERFLSSFDFSIIAKRLIDQLSSLNMDLNEVRSLLATSQGAAALLNVTVQPNNRLSEQAEKLAFAYTLENYNIFSGLKSSINSKTMITAINDSNRGAEQKTYLINLIETITSQPYKGFYLNAIARVMIWIVVAGLIVGLWMWSIGHVFGLTKGASIWYRIIVMICIAILFWPVSYIAFLLSYGSMKKKK